MEVHTQVCIVGAGPSGLTLANELQRYGIPFEIIERRTTPTVDSKAFALHARSLEVFSRMGVVDGMLARGLPVNGMAAYAGKRCVLGGDLSQIASEFPYVLSIPQADTEAVLLEHLQASGTDVQWGQNLVALQQHAEGVELQIRDSNDNVRELRCRWLIGCDGAHSVVRQLSRMEWQGDDYDFEFLVADGKIEWQGNHHTGHTFLNSQGYVMLFPLPQQRHRIVINVDAGQYRKDELSADLVNRILQERNLGSIHFHSPFWLSSTQGRRRIVSNFKHRRVVLAGDAAHVHSPLGGQGLNTGIQDAYQLAWRLAAAHNNPAAGQVLLSDYAAERHQVAQDVLKNTDKLTRLFTARAPLARLLRSVVMPLLSRRRKFAANIAATASGIGIRLSPAPVAFQGGVDKQLPGSRLAHGELLDTETGKMVIAGNVIASAGYELVLLLATAQNAGFYEAKRCVAHLLYDAQERPLASALTRCTLVSTPATLASVQAWPQGMAQSHFHDASAAWIKQYGVEHAHYLIVRPDGYIACGGALTSAEAVLHNLRTLLHLPVHSTAPTPSTHLAAVRLAEV